MLGYISSFTPADIVVVIAAIIGVAATIYTNKNTNDFQEDWNQKQLDADLKSKARIEWIQNVRNVTAELISIYYKLLNEADKTKLFDIYSSARAKSELLILYFGPENKNNQKNDEKEILLDTESNDGKNNSIVEYLESLSDDFYAHYKSTSNKSLKDLEEAKRKASYDVYKYPLKDGDFLYTRYDDDGNDYDVRDEPTWDPNLKEELKSTEKEITEYIIRVNKLSNGLVLLRNIIRIYLKIEWRKAKLGE